LAELEESIKVKQRTIAGHMTVINDMLAVFIRTLRSGNKIIVFGNGGSAADSQHIAGELVSKFKQVRRALPAIALTTDTSILTSIGNDFGFTDIFSRQVEALGQPGDVALGLSTSGNSANVLKAMIIAKEMGLVTVGFTGGSGGKLRDYVDLCFCVPSTSTPRIQEVHITVAHALCDLIEQEFD
jgi:D-sedoheptulose 7-phosphate isomerase